MLNTIKTSSKHKIAISQTIQSNFPSDKCTRNMDNVISIWNLRWLFRVHPLKTSAVFPSFWHPLSPCGHFFTSIRSQNFNSIWPLSLFQIADVFYERPLRPHGARSCLHSGHDAPFYSHSKCHLQYTKSTRLMIPYEHISGAWGMQLFMDFVIQRMHSI